jgi:hypothetical protein
MGSGQTALSMAARIGDPEVLKVVTDPHYLRRAPSTNGIPVQSVDLWSWDALRQAVEEGAANGKPHVVRLLVHASEWMAGQFGLQVQKVLARLDPGGLCGVRKVLMEDVHELSIADLCEHLVEAFTKNPLEAFSDAVWLAHAFDHEARLRSSDPYLSDQIKQQAVRMQVRRPARPNAPPAPPARPPARLSHAPPAPLPLPQLAAAGLLRSVSASNWRCVDGLLGHERSTSTIWLAVDGECKVLLSLPELQMHLKRRWRGSRKTSAQMAQEHLHGDEIHREHSWVSTHPVFSWLLLILGAPFAIVACAIYPPTEQARRAIRRNSAQFGAIRRNSAQFCRAILRNSAQFSHVHLPADRAVHREEGRRVVAARGAESEALGATDGRHALRRPTHLTAGGPVLADPGGQRLHRRRHRRAWALRHRALRLLRARRRAVRRRPRRRRARLGVLRSYGDHQEARYAT